MAEKKPTTKAHRGFIHIRKDPGIGGRPRRRRPRFPFGRGRLGPADEPLDRLGRPIRSPIQGGRRRRDPNRNPLMGIRPFPGMNRLTVEPQPIRRFPQMDRKQPTPEQRALMERQLRDLANRRRREQRRFDRQSTRKTNKELQARLRKGNLTPAQRKTLEDAMRKGELGGRGGSISPYQREQLALARRRQRRQRRLPQMTAGLGSLGSSIFNRATRAQRRAKGGMAFKSKDYVNPSNTVDNKKK